MTLIAPQPVQAALPFAPAARLPQASLVNIETSSDTVKFQGSFAGSPTPVTVKLPKRTGEQLAYLSQTLGLPVDEIASAASYLYTQANEGSTLLNRRFVGLVDGDVLTAQFTRPSSGFSQDRLFSTLDLSGQEFRTWKKQNISELSLSRGMVNKVADQFKSKESFTYKYQGTENEGAAAIGTFFGIVVPGLQVILPFTLTALVMQKGNKKRSLYNGVNLLHEAVRAKVKNPALRLVSVQVDHTDGGAKNPYIMVTSHDNLFRNMKL